MLPHRTWLRPCKHCAANVCMIVCMHQHAFMPLQICHLRLIKLWRVAAAADDGDAAGAGVPHGAPLQPASPLHICIYTHLHKHDCFHPSPSQAQGSASPSQQALHLAWACDGGSVLQWALSTTHMFWGIHCCALQQSARDHTTHAAQPESNASEIADRAGQVLWQVHHGARPQPQRRRAGVPPALRRPLRRGARLQLPGDCACAVTYCLSTQRCTDCYGEVRC